MKTDDGKLVVPVSGVYYIYLQLRLKVNINSDASPKVLAHRIYIERNATTPRSLPYNPVSEKYDSLYKTQNDYETTGYHGGLFYLNRGDAIVVNIANPCNKSQFNRHPKCDISIKHSNKANFYGAFLVTPLNVNLAKQPEP